MVRQYMGQESVELCLDRVSKYIGALEKRYPGVKKMMDGPVGTSYLSAPASTRLEYHSCYPGGLVVHSLNVVDNLFVLAEALCPKMFELQKLIFVGLFHDLGKAGDGENEYYLPNPSDWHREKLGQLYKTNERCAYMPTSERGLYLLQQHGIVVGNDEYVAIRLNDGMYVDENKPYRMKETRLALLVHWADRWAVEQEKILG
mgnify:CR=1 FL=1